MEILRKSGPKEEIALWNAMANCEAELHGMANKMVQVAASVFFEIGK